MTADEEEDNGLSGKFSGRMEREDARKTKKREEESITHSET